MANESILDELQKRLEKLPKHDRGISWESRNRFTGSERLEVSSSSANLCKWVLDNTEALTEALAQIIAPQPVTAEMASDLAAISANCVAGTPLSDKWKKVLGERINFSLRSVVANANTTQDWTEPKKQVDHEEDDIESLLQEHGWISVDGEVDLTKLPIFKLCIIQQEDGDFSQMLLEDCATITGSPVVVEPLYRMTSVDREIVGFQWHGNAPTPLSAYRTAKTEETVATWRDEITHPNNRLLFRRMCEKAGISLETDDIGTGLEKVAALSPAPAFSPAISRIVADLCVQKLAADEPFFVLLGRDPDAYRALQSWIILRQERDGLSKKTDAASAKLQEFRQYRRNRAAVPTASEMDALAASVGGRFVPNTCHLNCKSIDQCRRRPICESDLRRRDVAAQSSSTAYEPTPIAWCRFNQRTGRVAYWAHEREVVEKSGEVNMGGDLPILPVYVGSPPCNSMTVRRVRHRKGGEYDVLGAGTIQTTKPLEDMARVVIYRAADGSLWARDEAEFNDGRFEDIGGNDA